MDLEARLLVIALLLTSCAPASMPDGGANRSVPTSPATSSEVEPAADDRLGRFSKRRAMDHVRALAGAVGPRVRATNGEAAAARYIADRYETLGYNVNIQSFPVDGRSSRNVVAWWPGAKRYPVVLGAHMDTVPDAPGANDNASGVAVTLEIARLVAGTEQARWLRFVAFGSEERGGDDLSRLGSQAFVAKLGDEGRSRLAGMVSVDMVADGRPLLVADADIGPQTMPDLLYDIGSRLGVAMDTYTCDCSDHGPFETAGITAATLWSGEEPDFHSPSDTVQNMFPDDLLRTGRVVRAFVARLDLDLIRKLRRG